MTSFGLSSINKVTSLSQQMCTFLFDICSWHSDNKSGSVVTLLPRTLVSRLRECLDQIQTLFKRQTICFSCLLVQIAAPALNLHLLVALLVLINSGASLSVWKDAARRGAFWEGGLQKRR